MNYTWLLDPGHSGILKGKYLTPGKRSPNWKEHGPYYEGEGNRDFVRHIKKELDLLGVKSIIPYETELDLGLSLRLKIINTLHSYLGNCILLSVHSNAHSDLNTGNGLMAFTSIGKTRSDEISELYYEEMKRIFPNERYYTDTSDGDQDWEADFSMTKLSNCPAVLTENYFMTTKSDYMKLNDEEVRKGLILGHINMILRYEGIQTLNKLQLPYEYSKN